MLTVALVEQFVVTVAWFATQEVPLKEYPVGHVQEQEELLHVPPLEEQDDPVSVQEDVVVLLEVPAVEEVMYTQLPPPPRYQLVGQVHVQLFEFHEPLLHSQLFLFWVFRVVLVEQLVAPPVTVKVVLMPDPYKYSFELPALSVKVTLLTFQVPFSALEGIKRLADHLSEASAAVMTEEIWLVSVPDGPITLTETDFTPDESSEAETVTVNWLFALTDVG